jgi:hypothetical protein
MAQIIKSHLKKMSGAQAMNGLVPFHLYLLTSGSNGSKAEGGKRNFTAFLPAAMAFSPPVLSFSSSVYFLSLRGEFFSIFHDSSSSSPFFTLFQSSSVFTFTNKGEYGSEIKLDFSSGACCFPLLVYGFWLSL